MAKQNAISGVVGAIVATDDVAEVVETNGAVHDENTWKVFATHEEADSNRPEGLKSDKAKVFEVSRPEGSNLPNVFVWAFNGQAAESRIARHDGYKSWQAGGRKPRTVDKKAVLADSMTNMPEEDLRKCLPEVVVLAILAARQGSTTAAAQATAAEPTMPPVVATPPVAPVSGRHGGGRNKGNKS